MWHDQFWLRHKSNEQSEREPENNTAVDTVDMFE